MERCKTCEIDNSFTINLILPYFHRPLTVHWLVKQRKWWSWNVLCFKVKPLGIEDPRAIIVIIDKFICSFSRSCAMCYCARISSVACVLENKMNTAILNIIVRIWMLETFETDELELKSNIDFYLEINAWATEKLMPNENAHWKCPLKMPLENAPWKCPLISSPLISSPLISSPLKWTSL